MVGAKKNRRSSERKKWRVKVKGEAPVAGVLQFAEEVVQSVTRGGPLCGPNGLSSPVVSDSVQTIVPLQGHIPHSVPYVLQMQRSLILSRSMQQSMILS